MHHVIHLNSSAPNLKSKNGSDTGSDGTEADGVAASSTSELRRRRGEGRGPDGDGRAGDEGGDGGVGGSRSSLRAGRGGDGAGQGDSAVRRSGGSASGDNTGLGRLSGGGGGGGLALALVGVGDTELGRVLVGTLVGAGLDNEEDTVVGDVVLELGAGGPDVLAAVADVLSDGVQRDDVGAGSTEEDKGDAALGGGGPGDGVGLASGDELIQAGLDDGIAGRSLRVVGGGPGSSNGHDGGENTSCGETHFDVFMCGLS